MAIKAVSLDFWNTLFTEPPGGFAFYQERRRSRLTEALSEWADITGERIESACAEEAALHHRIWRHQHRTPETAERIGQILTTLEARLPDDAMRSLIADYEEGILERPPILIKGVRETLESLAVRYRLGVISDVGFSPGRVLREIMRRNDLLRFFDSLIFSDEAGCAKPHGRVFARTVANLGVKPGEIVHVGDLEHTDIVGAKRAGYYAIRFTGVTPMGDQETTGADRVTTDFSELPELIQKLESDTS